MTYIRGDLDLETMAMKQKDHTFIVYGITEPIGLKKTLLTVVWIALSALFIFGCIAASGKFAERAAGLKAGNAMIGLSGGIFALSLLQGDFKHKKSSLAVLAAITAITVLLGTFGSTGILSAKQMGWGIIGTNLIATVPSVLARNSDYKKRYRLKKSST